MDVCNGLAQDEARRLSRVDCWYSIHRPNWTRLPVSSCDEQRLSITYLQYTELIKKAHVAELNDDSRAAHPLKGGQKYPHEIRLPELPMARRMATHRLFASANLRWSDAASNDCHLTVRSATAMLSSSAAEAAWSLSYCFASMTFQLAQLLLRRKATDMTSVVWAASRPSGVEWRGWKCVLLPWSREYATAKVLSYFEHLLGDPPLVRIYRELSYRLLQLQIQVVSVVAISRIGWNRLAAYDCYTTVSLCTKHDNCHELGISKGNKWCKQLS